MAEGTPRPRSLIPVILPPGEILDEHQQADGCRRQRPGDRLNNRRHRGHPLHARFVDGRCRLRRELVDRRYNRRVFAGNRQD